MKILFVTFALAYSGAGKMIAYLANAFSSRGYHSIIYVQEKSGHFYEPNADLDIIYEDKYFNNYLTRHFCQARQLRRRVKEIKPDLIVSFNTNQNAMSVYAAAFRKIPVIVSERGDPYQYRNLIARIKRSIINSASGGVFQTHKALEYYGKGLQKRSCVIYNPCTVKNVTFYPWEKRTNSIAFIARFDIKQKRQDLMIEAFRLVSNKIPDISLHFYGDGNDLDFIIDKVKEYNLEDKVFFHGVVKNIPDVIVQHKVFVLTSDFEGLPNALIEAMACGLVCISTDCSPGGARELIVDGQNGYIVPCGNFNLLCERIIEAFENDKKSEQVAKNAMLISKKLDEDCIYDQWEEYINHVYEESK